MRGDRDGPDEGAEGGDDAGGWFDRLADQTGEAKEQHGQVEEEKTLPRGHMGEQQGMNHERWVPDFFSFRSEETEQGPLGKGTRAIEQEGQSPAMPLNLAGHHATWSNLETNCDQFSSPSLSCTIV